MITVKMYTAEEGDAFLISFGEDKDINVIIDMGRATTYESYIKSDLEALRVSGKKIDLLVITHIDNDHIEGAIPFIKDNGNEDSIIKVDEVWHNSYRHLQFEKEKVTETAKRELDAITSIISQNPNSTKKDGVSDVGVSEGVTLASLLYEYKYNWNKTFDNKAVCIENKNNFNLGKLNFILLSPDREKLQKLADVWVSKLDSIFYNFQLSDDKIFDDAFELFMQNQQPDNTAEIENCSNEDTEFNIEQLAAQKEENEYSETNGSSISFIIEYNNKKLLFLGDSHKKIIYENLKKLEEQGYVLDFELVKVSHHGSNKNISKKLINLINSNRYLISTNGNLHCHPDISTIAKIATKSSEYTKSIIFNHKQDKINLFENEELYSKYNYNIQYLNQIEIK